MLLKRPATIHQQDGLFVHVSAFLPEEIDTNTAKILMAKVMEMIKNDR